MKSVFKPIILGTGLLASLGAFFAGCMDKEKQTGTNPVSEVRIVAATPSSLETGIRTSISIVGSETSFGDSVWLEKGSMRIPGQVKAGSTDTSMIAYFEIPTDAGTGAWDLVVGGDKEGSSFRLKTGVAILPALARIVKVTPSKMSEVGRQYLEIVCEGIDLKAGGLQAAFTHGSDTLRISRMSFQNEVSLDMDVEVEQSATWDLEVSTSVRRMRLSNALVTELPAYSLVSASPDSVEQDVAMAVTITGAHTRFGQATRTVWLENGSDTIASTPDNTIRNGYSVIVESDTKLTAFFMIPADAKLGKWELKVRQPWYTLALPGGIKMGEPTAPAVTSVTPASGQRGKATILSITGRRVSWSQGTQTTIQISLVNGTDTLFRGYAIRGEVEFSGKVITNPYSIRSDAPLGPCDVHASYYVPPGILPEKPGGGSVTIKPLKDGFTILE